LSDEEMRRLRGKQMSMIFQDPTSSLNPSFTIGYQMMEKFILHEHLKDREAVKESVRLLKMMGVPSAAERLKDYPHQMSGGMRQRIMIAIALSCNPDLVIADEPTTNVDATIQAQILELMKDLKERLGISILLITHHMGLVAEICERAIVMYSGMIAEESDVYSLFKEPLHPYTQALLKCIPRASKQSTELESIEGMVPDLVNPPPGCRFHPRCPHAFDRCPLEEPRLYEVGDRRVACHLYDK
jgi:oligopeptide/dipeptide ABC transporter ATP-binding protein